MQAMAGRWVPASANYEHTLDLPAGTHFVRTEFNNDGGTARSLTINSLNVSGATINNVNSNANAWLRPPLIRKLSQGRGQLAGGRVPGTQVNVELKRHAFNFGTTVPNSFTDTLLINNRCPDRTPSGISRRWWTTASIRFPPRTAENGTLTRERATCFLRAR